MIHAVRQPLILLLYSVVISLILFWVYAPALSGPFLFDDHYSVVLAELRSFSLKDITGFILADQSSLFHRPLSLLSFSVNHLFYSGDTISFKAVNLAIHIANVIFIHLLTIAILTRLHTLKLICISSKDIHILSFIVASIWGLHPILVSTNMYVVQRMASMSAFFTLAALIVYVRQRNRKSSGGKYCPYRIALGTTLFILGFLSKENAITIFLYILVLEITLYKRGVSVDRSLFSSRVFTGMILISTAVSIMLLFVFKDSFFNGYQMREYNLVERLLTQVHVLWLYIHQILLPNIDNMSLYWDHFEITRSINASTGLLISCYVAAILWAITKRSSQSVFCIGILFFFASHLLESTIFPLELVFEHRNYLALYGIVLLFVWSGFILSKRLNNKKLALLTVAMVLIPLSLQTRFRSLEWSDHMVVTGLAAMRTPESLRANDAYIISLLDKNLMSNALQHIDKMLGTSERKSNYLLRKLYIKTSMQDTEGFDYTLLKQTLSKEKLGAMELNSLANIQDYTYQNSSSQPSTQKLEELFHIVVNSDNLQLRSAAQAMLVDRYTDLLWRNDKKQQAIALAKSSYYRWPNDAVTLIRYLEYYSFFKDISENEELYNKLINTKFMYTSLEARYKSIFGKLNISLSEF